MSTLEKRLEALEASTGGASGCDRGCGLVVTVSHAITGEHHSATWNGEAISECELFEHRTETRCPRCGRELKTDKAPVIRLGGLG
jgi:hypothetical protein